MRTAGLIFILSLSFGLKGQISRKDTSVIYRLDYSKSHISYPTAALNHTIQGKVFILFDVDSTCALVNRRVEKGLGYGCDQEALKQLDSAEVILKTNTSPNVIPERTTGLLPLLKCVS